MAENLEDKIDSMAVEWFSRIQDPARHADASAETELNLYMTFMSYCAAPLFASERKGSQFLGQFKPKTDIKHILAYKTYVQGLESRPSGYELEKAKAFKYAIGIIEKYFPGI